MVWGGKLVVWGGLGCFGVVWGVSTDPRVCDRIFCDIPLKTNAMRHIAKVQNP